MRFITICCALIAIAAQAVIAPSPDVDPLTARSIWFQNAERLIRLPDGSEVLLINRPAPNERVSVDASIVSPKGRDYDTNFRVVKWIPGEVAEGTTGQIYSVAMSDDHDWLAVVGGWMGRDGRGHNGVFILRRQAQPNFDYWQLKSSFDVRGMTIGEIEFGPGGTLITTSHEENQGGPAPMITIFSFAGQKLGSFITAAKHGDLSGASSCRLMRMTKLGPASYAAYDPENSLIRFFTVSSNAPINLQQSRTVPVLFAEKRSYLLALDILADGRIAIARTVVDDNHRGRTLISVLAPDGHLIEEWTSPRVWQYAYARDHVLKGVYPAAADRPTPVIRSIAIK